ncbi:conjugation system SOS inhibitor PsiB [Siccibacter turicensis]|uniref:conjugation system SOS inhibitor PsiB n=1 Tax=Siccibacter turicensis TaxID=357233 RepID=UPI0004675A16|nr:conjugation system SOS inhibitor PsiB [Siccibacter turicensis]
MKFDLATMNTFIPSDFELVREQGETDRLQLSNAVVRAIDTPKGWQVNAEYRGEFGGLFPVQCRYTPDNGENYTVCLCSPGEVSLVWLCIVIDGNGHLAQVVHQSDTLEPERVSQLLAQVSALHDLHSPAERVVTLLKQEVAV